MRKLVIGLIPLVVVALVIGAIGCGGGEGKPTATPTPTPTATVVTLPAGWTLHAAHNFEIGLPENWFAFEVSPEAIDALIEEMGPTNPEWIPYMEALKHQENIDLWALDPESPPTFAANILVGHEIRFLSLDQYIELGKQQYESLGYAIVVGEKFDLRGSEAVILEMNSVAYYPSGEPYEAEQQSVIVDHGGYRYSIILSYQPDDAQKYKKLLAEIIQTFNIVR
ncbi:hypothetical protein ACFLXV_04205 [Chloroflexota bacterium]